MTLMTKRFQYSQLIPQFHNGKRLYLCPDGLRVPSVTTIISQTKSEQSKAAIKAWEDKEGPEKAQQIKDEAAKRGTQMHKFLEDYMLNGSLSQPDEDSKQSHIMAEHIVNKGLVNVNEIWGSEIGLYYPGLYSGTTDAIGIHKNEAAILDYKQSNKFKSVKYVEDYFLQITAYALAHNKVYGTNINRGVILLCVAPPLISPGVWGEPTYQEFILKPEDFDYWTNKWWARVEEYYTKTLT